MKVLAWVFIGLIGAVSTYISLTTDDNQMAIMSGLIGGLSWMLFAYFSLEIAVYTQNGDRVITRYPSMAAYGLAMAAPNIYVALTGPLELVRNRDTEIKQEVG